MDKYKITVEELIDLICSNRAKEYVCEKYKLPLDNFDIKNYQDSRAVIFDYNLMYNSKKIRLNKIISNHESTTGQ